MIILADIGNQRVKWRCGELSGNFATGEFATGMETAWGELSAPDSMAVANVAGDRVGRILCDFAARRWKVAPAFIKPTEKACSVTNSHYDLDELGADRWAAMVGARRLTALAAVIVDCGTAITIDALSQQGEFVGGSIMPGFHLATQALQANAQGIGEHSLHDVVLPARSTAEAVRSGSTLGIAGGAERLVRSYLSIIGTDADLLLTGGDATLLADNSELPFILAPDLVLTGIAALAEKLGMENS